MSNGTIWTHQKKYCPVDGLKDATHYRWPFDDKMRSLPLNARDSEEVRLNVDDWESSMTRGVISGPVQWLQRLGLKLYREEEITSTDLEVNNLKNQVAKMAESLEQILEQLGGAR